MNGNQPTMPDITKIKADVGRMIDQNAPETDIETYLASEGVTVQDLQGRMSRDDEAMYTQLAQDPSSTAASLQGFVRSRGFDLTDADAQAFIAQRSKNPNVGDAVQYRTAPEDPAGPRPSPKAEPNTALETASATAGEFMDGIIPGTGKALAGVGGALGNSIAAGLGMTDWRPGRAYAEEAAAHDRDQDRLEQDNPSLATAANWAGFGTSFALPMARVARGGRLRAGVLNSAVTATGYGALSGALNDSGDGRLANAANGAIVGGVMGATAPVAFRKVGDTIATARRNIPGVNGILTGLENIPRRLTGKALVPASASAHAQAERIIGQNMNGALIDTGMGTGMVPATPDSIAAEAVRRGSVGVPAMPADMTEPLRRSTAWALQGGGTMARRARGELEARQAQAGSRTRQHIAQELGATVDPIAEVEAIRRRASQASEPGYRAAYAEPVVVTPKMREIMRTPAFQDALPQAVRNIRNAQRDPAALGFALDTQGNISGVDALSTEGFDQVIRAMRDSGKAAMDNSGFRPRNTTNSVHINARARDLRGALADQNPAYRDVTANYADEMALTDALQRGGDVAKLSGAEIEAQRRGMPPHAEEAWMAAARTALADAATYASANPAANVAQAVRQRVGLSGAGLLSASGDTAKLQAIEAMSGRPGVIARLDDRLEGEDQAWRTFAATRAPKRSGGPLEDATGNLGTAMALGRKLSTGNVLGTLSDVVLRGNPRGTLLYRSDVQDRMAEILTAAPQDAQPVMGAVANRATADEASRGTLHRRAGNLARIGILQAAGQSTDPVALPDVEGLETPPTNEDAAPFDRAPLYRRPAR